MYFQVLGLLFKNEIEALTDCEVMRKFYLKQSDKIDEKEIHSQDWQ